MGRHFLKDRCGATAIEYALIAGLIALAIVVGAAQTGQQLKASYGNVASKVTTANQ
ncbi:MULTISPECIES: Flp family type IVb pilin [Alphaproteobacteria]|uniref:Flp family type IVb pilin n=1 Tax=Alphaproteobacteria TaxID=28211 RepID=UPI0019D3D68F|nr:MULTISPECIES: Flp family type IVb pilin [Alphaproteobacteria]MBY6022499.1 Flp family type IVb pilin [Nitratireductor sp. DP7N14-4]MBN7757708.1 Flp family type IVb pilin [Nitratireductor aquimarinus]MBN7762173.1 Flp family type IVb pilin [Nitratireductor aquibiodomus]MBY6000471.1 Flp family type IVb pilin [Tritonibacter mobilis]MDV2968667.1 Flp family type IVb pilin [Nitratireductor aquimarinus]